MTMANTQRDKGSKHPSEQVTHKMHSLEILLQWKHTHLHQDSKQWNKASLPTQLHA